MNNQTLMDDVSGLVQRWDDFIAQLTPIQPHVPNPGNPPLLGLLIGYFQQRRDDVEQQRPNLDHSDEVDDNLAIARPLFDQSRTTLLTYEPAVTLIVNSVPTDVRGHATEAAYALHRAIAEFLRQATSVGTDIGGRANLAGLRNTVDDLSTYPILTQGVGYAGTGGYGPGSGSGGGGGGGTATLGQIVERTITDVLGRRPRVADTKSFASALNQSFALSEQEGHTIVTWNQRAGSGTSELGAAVTGAQASLYQRARGALDAILPSIDAVEPLVEADDEQMEASRSIVRNQVSELVKELGTEGGPRVQRVDDMFEMLLDRDFNVQVNGASVSIGAAAALRAELGAGEIGRFGYVCGLTSDHVNTIVEEQNLTKFIVMRDHVRALRDSWTAFRTGFVGDTQAYFGTQLVHVTRCFGVIVESVDEVEFAMDSVFFGRAERDTTRITFPPPAAGVNGQQPPPGMFASELLSWAREFATGEGPRLITDGGKVGARGCVPTLSRLASLVRGAAEHRQYHPAWRHPRVLNALRQLASQIDQTRRLVELIR
jgi:hypothetical protein